jgi:anti-anti-sigma factor
VTSTTPTLAGGVFGVEQAGDTILVVPAADLRELDYLHIEAGARAVLDLLRRPGVKNVIVDFCETDYYGTTALGFFLRFWKAVRERGGRMAFCNLSAHEEEVLHVTNLDHLWPVCPSRAEALEAVQCNGRRPAETASP